MTSIKKRMHYRFNRLLYRLQWAVLKRTRVYCWHFCRFCKYRDECMLDIMLVINGHKYIK